MKYAQITGSGRRILPSGAYLEQLTTYNLVLVGTLGLMVLVSRLIFQSHILYHWDSVNFAFAIEEFNLAKEQPQPPGYIVYVWMSRLVHSWTGDAQTTLVSISIVASVLAAVALFYLGQSMFDRRSGLIAALFLAASPLFWFYGEIALPHTLDSLLVIVSVWWLYETMLGKHAYLYPAVTVSAIAGGVRPQTLVFLVPLILFALRGVGWRRFLTAGVLGAAICLGWFIPLMILSGGVSSYLHILSNFSTRFQSTTSVLMGAGWWGVRRNLIKLTLYTSYAWSIAILPAAVYATARIYRRQWPRNWEKMIFLILWIGPTLAFYGLIHMGQQGLVFVFLPALLLISAAGLTRLLANHPRWLVVTTTAVIVLNLGIFSSVPEYPLGPGKQRLLTRDTLINSDRYYQDRIETIQNNFAVGSTAILATNWHHLEYYLPQYTVLQFNIGNKWEVDAGLPKNNLEDVQVSSPADLGLDLNENNQMIVVFFDPGLEPFNQTPESVKALSLPNGGQLRYFELGPSSQLYIDTDSFGLLAN